MGLNVVSSASADRLVAHLGHHLAAPRRDPLTADVVVVPGRGMAEWLQEHLPAHLGPAGMVANIEFWLPGELTRHVAVGPSVASAAWDVAYLKWSILELLSTRADTDTDTDTGTGTGTDTLAPGFASAQRRLRFATRAADLLDRYANQRPEMILAWLDGQMSDGRHPLAPQHRWQAQLWRELRSLLGESWPELRQRSAQTADGRLLGDDLERLAVFGTDFMSRSTIDTLARLGRLRDVTVFHLSPVEGLVAEFGSRPVAIDSLRREVNLTGTRAHPLLAAWSRSALESAALLASVADDVETVSATPRGSVLGSLQTALLADERPQGAAVTSSTSSFGDGSVQIHRCHGPTRQVEVLRDAILHVMAADPTLRPRDVIVVCPQLETFAPIIEAVVSAPLDERSRHLPVSIVDRSTATATPIALAVEGLLRLVSGRCTVPEMLEVLSLDVVRRRFDLTDADLQMITGWTEQLGVRWGLDADHRAAWGYPADVDEGTWRWAIERLAAGVVLQSPELVEDLPGLAVFDDLSGADALTVGKLFDFHRSLSALHRMTAVETNLGAWADVLGFVLDRFVAVDRSGRGQLLAARAVVKYLYDASTHAPTATFGVAEMIDLLAEHLPGIRSRGQRWADVVRVGTPALFRGVPARVVAVLGFDDDAVKTAARSADDILTFEPRLGERDHRADERLGLLTLVHAAQECLIITCNGRNVNDNSQVPMPVPLEELYDAVAGAIARMPEADRGRRPIVVDHSRQAADPVNVGVGARSKDKNASDFVDGPWTFDPSVPRLVALGAAGHDATDTDLASFTLPPLPDERIAREIGLTSLADAVRRPTEVFVRERLGVAPAGADAATDWEVPLWPSSLEYANLGRELMEAMASASASASEMDPTEWQHRRALLGGLPLKATAGEMWNQLQQGVDGVVGVARQVLDAPERLVEVRIAVPDRDVQRLGGISVVVNGSVPVHATVRVSLNFARWHRRMRVGPWLDLAALTMHDPDVPWTAHVAARPENGDAPDGVVEEFRLRGDDPDERVETAIRVLCFANEVRYRAMRSAIPLFERTSWMLGASASVIKMNLSYDLGRPATRLVFGTRDIDSLRADPLVAGIDDGLPEAGSRIDAYGAWLTEIWDETVEVLTSPTKVGKRKKSSKAAAP